MGLTSFEAIGIKKFGEQQKPLFTDVINVVVTFDPPSLSDGAGAVSSGIEVVGARPGDFVLVSAPYDLQGVIASGFVSDDDEVKIALVNMTGSTVDLDEGDWNIKVLRG